MEKPSRLGSNAKAQKQQSGYIWKVGRSWYGRWREDVLQDGHVIRKQIFGKLAEVCDRFRSKADVRPLLAEKLRPLNERCTCPEGTLPVSEFVANCYLPFVVENLKPSTANGYQTRWQSYLALRLSRVIVRDFRTVDTGSLLAEIHREHELGRTTLKHIKSFLSGVFTYAKNQGAYDGVNPIRDAMIPEKAAKPLETYAASPDEVLAMMEALDKAGEPKASTAVALIVLCWLAPWRSAWRVLGRLRRSANAGSAIRVARVRERT
jgi:hypothetical protein